MKTKEIIRLLQEADPTGEEECSVGNYDIHFVYPQPAYYDGRQQVLVRDEKGNIVGAKYREKGTKIRIVTLSIEDAIFDREDLPVDFSDLSESQAEYKKAQVEEYRKQAIGISNDVEREHFCRYLLNKIPGISSSFAENFYNENLDYRDILPSDIKEEYSMGYSFADRREMQWDREIQVDTSDPDNVKIELKRNG